MLVEYSLTVYIVHSVVEATTSWCSSQRSHRSWLLANKLDIVDCGNSYSINCPAEFASASILWNRQRCLSHLVFTCKNTRCSSWAAAQCWVYTLQCDGHYFHCSHIRINCRWQPPHWPVIFTSITCSRICHDIHTCGVSFQSPFAMRYFLQLEWYIMPYGYIYIYICVCVCVFASPTARRYFVESSTIWLKLRPDYVWPRLFRPFLPTGSWLFDFLRDRFYFQPCHNMLQHRLYMFIHAHSWVIMYNVSNYGV